MLEALREVTLAFRDDEQIWVTNFTFRENGKGTLIGKAADQKFVIGAARSTQDQSALRRGQAAGTCQTDARRARCRFR